MRVLVLTALALAAFAANSLLCRAALRGGLVDPATFSSVRLLSGAAVLVPLAAARGRGGTAGAGLLRGDWTSAVWLFLYAVPFSFAYRSLDAGTGALVLFGAVQATMWTAGIAGGERPGTAQWMGLTLAAAGLVHLVLPGASAPSPTGFLLMATAGAAWGAYSLRGRRARDPLGETAGNFARSLPLVAAVELASLPVASFEGRGIALAAASGALASGLGYSIWYVALPGLGAVRAATAQLGVPVLAAAGGVLFLGEAVTPRLAVAAVLVLGGVGLALRARRL